MNEAPEEWRTIIGFPDYEVSDLGAVRRAVPEYRAHPKSGKLYLHLPAGRLLIPGKYSDGYQGVSLYGGDALARGKTHIRIRVSVLVCRAFHGEPPSPEHEVAHNNGQCDDDRATNLRWATKKENGEDKIRHGKSSRGTKNYTNKLSNADVIRIRELFAAALSNTKIASMYGVASSTVDRIKSGKLWGWLP